MRTAALLPVILGVSLAHAGVGDVQTKTDHPWYPGELSCSTFPRLFATQAELYARVTGQKVASDQDKALASWYWRNLNYWHGEEGLADLWNAGFGKGIDGTSREYWTGLFGDGFSLCFATHAQWHGEMVQLLGPGRSRSSQVEGHTSFEVYLKGGPYGDGQWGVLDHDISTVVFTPDGSRLMSMLELSKDAAARVPGNLTAERQHGWRAGGLHPDDPKAYAAYKAAHYAAGYAGPPPLVHLRSGESLRRYLKPGLEDGKTFVFWGRNYRTGGIPGPERSRTWVNEPEKMFQATRDCGYKPGQARYANYTYRPDFASGRYKEGVIDEGLGHVTFEFYSPYVVAARPPNDKDWGVYDGGCTGGLAITGKSVPPVSISTDQGKTWQKAPSGPTAPASAPAGASGQTIDLTDLAKGHHQYWLRLEAPVKELAKADLTIRTVCQCSSSVIPRVRAGQNRVTFQSTGLAFLAAGPNLDQAAAHLVEGAMGTPGPITLELATPRKEKAVALYAASRQESASPPRPCCYQIEYSTDGGKTYRPVVKDWTIVRHEPEPGDFWSQSFCWGDVPLDDVAGPVRVRFSNDGGRKFQKVEAHLVYRVQNTSPVKVAYAWKEGAEVKRAERTYPGKAGPEDASWTFTAGPSAETFCVEYAAQ
jgi:hypothetical protein